MQSKRFRAVARRREQGNPVDTAGGDASVSAAYRQPELDDRAIRAAVMRPGRLRDN